MKKIIYITLIFICSCTTKSTSENKVSNENIIPNKKDKILSKKSSINTKEKFVKYNLENYNCEELNYFLIKDYDMLDTNLLTLLDSNISTRFDINNSIGYGDYSNFYLYSKDGKLGAFSLITVIGEPTVTEHPLVLLIINKDDSIINSILVANKYRESGGCLTSTFLNDSTLRQEFEWFNPGVNGLTGEDINSTDFLIQEAIISPDGGIKIEEIKRWTVNE